MLEIWWWDSAANPDATQQWCRANQHWLKAPIANTEKQLSQLFRRHLLASYTQQVPEQLQFFVGDKGKPSLLHSSLHFNVSHSDNWHLLIVSDLPCGIDVEPWNRLLTKVRKPAALKRFAEQDLLMQADDTSFLQCWTMKEALAKYHGQSVWEWLGTSLLKTQTGWQTPNNLNSGHLDVGACVSWVAKQNQAPRVKAFDLKTNG